MMATSILIISGIYIWASTAGERKQCPWDMGVRRWMMEDRWRWCNERTIIPSSQYLLLSAYIYHTFYAFAFLL